ncbi:UNVERIFIED_CONTAM: hypothetical protein HDU68_012876 [Siphonaria sp. JEL0065]|nr:hypothetical protein HDU68_012876 [Siphonaria sp. JEL0065]
MFATAGSQRKPAARPASSVSATSSSSRRSSKAGNENSTKPALTRPAAPLASLSFQERKVLSGSTSTGKVPESVLVKAAKLSTASKPNPTTTATSTKPTNRAPMRTSLSQNKPASKVAYSSRASSTQIAPLKKVHITSLNTAPVAKQRPQALLLKKQDSFDALNIEDILEAENTRDLDKKTFAKPTSAAAAGTRPGAARRNTTFGTLSRHVAEKETTENIQKRASIYAGPVRVIRKIPTATAPAATVQQDDYISHSFSSFNTSFSHSNSSELASHSHTQSRTSILQPTQPHAQQPPIIQQERPSSVQEEATLHQSLEPSRSLMNTHAVVATAGLVPLPQTPSSMKPPQRVAIQEQLSYAPPHYSLSRQSSAVSQHNHQQNERSSASILIEAVGSTSLYKSAQSLSSASNAPQLLQTPRRILDQTKTRTLGMAVLDMMTPTRAKVLGVAGGGSLMSKFKEHEVNSIESGEQKKDAILIVQPPITVQQQQQQQPQQHAPMRALLPNPFEVLGISQPCSSDRVDVTNSAIEAQPSTALSTATKSRGLPDVFAFMASGNTGDEGGAVEEKLQQSVVDEAAVETGGNQEGGATLTQEGNEVIANKETMDSISNIIHQQPEAVDNAPTDSTPLDSNLIWKRVSPRRVSSSSSGTATEREYRGGIRAVPVSTETTPVVTENDGEKKRRLQQEAELGELELRFRGIASQLLGRVHHGSASYVSVAAEPVTVKEVVETKPVEGKDRGTAVADKLNHDQINCELDVLDEEERRLIREIRKMGVHFDADF